MKHSVVILIKLTVGNAEHVSSMGKMLNAYKLWLK